jgi:hypothetical protein
MTTMPAGASRLDLTVCRQFDGCLMMQQFLETTVLPSDGVPPIEARILLVSVLERCPFTVV